MTRKVLYIQPVGCEGPELIEAIRPAHLEAIVCRPVIGHPVPADAGDYSAIVVLGGPMGVYESEEHPWITPVIDLLRDALAKQVPVLGICLGSQLLASAAGAEVRPSGIQEIGWFPITLTPSAQADRLLAGVSSPLHVFHWHGDRWELPEGATLLASSEKCDHQAFRIGEKSYGFQFHMELTPDIPPLWADAYEDDLLRDNTLPSKAQVSAESLVHGPTIERQAREVFRRFWELCG